MEKEFYVTGNNKDRIVLYVCPSSSLLIGASGGAIMGEDNVVRRTQSLGCLDFESGGALECRSKETNYRFKRSSSVCQFGSQMSLLQDDDIRGFGCSANNLDTDCVSPRVSTNSLASQTENYADVELGGLSPYSSSRRLLLTDVPSSSSAALAPCLHGRPSPSCTTSRLQHQQQQHLSPRQAAAVVVGPDELPVARSTSCPSVPQQVRRHPLSTLTVAGGVGCEPTLHLRADLDDDPLFLRGGNDGPHRTSQSRGDLGLRIESIESDSFNVTTPTAEDRDNRISPHHADFQTEEADRLLGGGETKPDVAAKINFDIGTHSKGSNLGPRAHVDVCSRQLVEPLDHDNHKMAAGKASQSLARKKCLQWLKSLDEGD